MNVDLSTIEAWYGGFQERFALGIEDIDGSTRFRSDVWHRDEGGGGDTRVLSDGDVIEKAAVNFSAVHGPTPKGLSERMAAAGSRFYATGVSIIVHPRNPHAPTFHANVRYFESDAGSAWFGGGADLTPYYLYEDDARHFHAVLRDVSGRHPVADHDAWKRECDAYFRLHHRDEARGVGGVFFDHLTERLPEVWAYQQDLADHLLDAYLPILRRRIHTPTTADQRHWHELRRARYVEFNLIWDRGTRFGLETGGRAESILVSMPPRARWEYSAEPSPGTPEALLLDMVRSEPRSWD